MKFCAKIGAFIRFVTIISLSHLTIVGMSQVFPVLLGTVGTVGTGIIGGLASGTCWDVPSSPSTSWGYQDWDSRGSGIRDLLGCPK